MTPTSTSEGHDAYQYLTAAPTFISITPDTGTVGGWRWHPIHYFGYELRKWRNNPMYLIADGSGTNQMPIWFARITALSAVGVIP